LLAFQAPGVGSSRVRFVTLEKAHTLATINRVRDVFAHESDAMATMDRAVRFRRRSARHA